MKNFKTTCHKLRLALVLVLMLGIKLNAQNTFQDRVPIRETLYGINAWGIVLSPTISIANLWPLIREAKKAGIRVIRVGGIEFSYRPIYSFSGTAPYSITSAVILKLIIDSIRSNGMQPIIQVGYNPVCSLIPPLGGLALDSQAVIAGRLVRYLNKGILSGNPVKLFSIANEPDLPNNSCNTNDPGGFTYSTSAHSNTICTYFKAFSFQMKSADSSIRILGPDLAMFSADTSWAVNPEMRELLRDPVIYPSTSIMGTIQSGPAIGKFYTDVVAFHYYLRSAPSPTDVSNSVDKFRDKITSTGGQKRGLLQMIPSSRNIGNLHFACTEINIDLQSARSETATGQSYDSLMASNDNRGFRAAQWICDIYRNSFALSDSMPGQPRESWLEFLTVWSIKEGDCNNGLGILSGCPANNFRKRPMYHALQLLTEHFKGTYYRGFVTAGFADEIKTFASVEKHGWKIMVINYGNTQHDFRINVDGSNTTSGTHPVTLNFHLNYDPLLLGNAMGAPAFLSANTGTLTNPLPPNSIVILTFYCDGSIVHRIDYTLQDAISLVGAKITQIGGNIVNSGMISCSLPGGIGGAVTTSTYMNTTIPVTSDLTMASGVSLSFTNCVIVMGEGTKITGSGQNQITLKNCIMVGCQGLQFEGIILNGTGSGESLICDSTIIVNGNNPFYLDNVPTVMITRNFIANGSGVGTSAAITLLNSKGFLIAENFIGAFGTGINTSYSSHDFPSKIDKNIFTDIDYPIHLNNDGHDSLDITCNSLTFRQVGILSESTILKNQGTPSLGAGNTFKKTLWDDPSDYLHHTGNTPTYYYGPAEAPMFTVAGVMDITTTSASGDRSCQMPVAVPCEPWILSVKEETKISGINILVFPNPSTGAFSLEITNGKGNYSMTVHDMLGRLVSNRPVDFNTEKTVKFNIKAKGLYIVSLQNQNSRITQKVIVE